MEFRVPRRPRGVGGSFLVPHTEYAVCIGGLLGASVLMRLQCRSGSHDIDVILPRMSHQVTLLLGNDVMTATYLSTCPGRMIALSGSGGHGGG